MRKDRRHNCCYPPTFPGYPFLEPPLSLEFVWTFAWIFFQCYPYQNYWNRYLLSIDFCKVTHPNASIRFSSEGWARLLLEISVRYSLKHREWWVWSIVTSATILLILQENIINSRKFCMNIQNLHRNLWIRGIWEHAEPPSSWEFHPHQHQTSQYRMLQLA